MIIELHPTYTFRVEIKDRRNTDMNSIPAPPPHRFFDRKAGKTGCDEVLAVVKDALAKAGLSEFDVSLDRFEHRA